MDLKRNPYQRTTSWNTPYTFSSKEKDAETGYGYFGARYYDSGLSIWLSVDPMSDKYPSMSPYNYCANNPVILVDPDGREFSPIYDTGGNFLGTDDEGLKGDAIIMKRSDFKQGMSHEKALSKSTNLCPEMFDEASAKLNSHYSSLKDRPDYDGKITLNEAKEWYQNGNGQPLFVDASQIDLSPVSVDDFNGLNSSIYHNFQSLDGNNSTGLVYGTIKLTLWNYSKGNVKLGNIENGFLDRYDFNTDGRFLRDIATSFGRLYSGVGTGFNIYSYGLGTVKK